MVPFGLYALVRHYVPEVPFWDEWDINVPIAVGVDRGTLPLAFLWHQHNEHRHFFPELLALVLVKLGGYSVRKEALTSVAVATLELAAAYALARRALSENAALCLAPVLAALLFSLAQWENWTWSFQLAWFVTNAFALGSILVLGSRALGPARFGAAAALAVGTAYSAAFGFAIFPAGLMMLLLRRPAEFRKIAIWIVVAAVAAGFYAIGYVRGASPLHALGIGQLGEVATYALAYLGAPVAGAFGTAPMVAAGASALAAAFAVCALGVRASNAPGAAGMVSGCAGLCTYAACAATLTAFGRAGGGLVIASRYATTAVVFWLGVAIALAWFAGRPELARRWAALAKFGTVGYAAVLALAFVQSERAAYPYFAVRSEQMMSGAAALRAWPSGSDTRIRDIYPSVARVIAVDADLGAVDHGVAADFVRLPPQHLPMPTEGSLERIAAEDRSHRAAPLGAVPRAGALILDGWAAGSSMPWGAEPRTIDVWLDDRSCGCATVTRVSRPDLAEVVPGLHDGFHAVLTLDRVSPGVHALTLVVEAPDGGRRRIPSRPEFVVE